MSNPAVLRKDHSYGKESNKWYIAYTYSKAERKALEKMENMGVSSFLPLHKVVRNWSDRRKIIEVPLFPNYIFIYTSASHMHELLKLKELIRYVTFDGKAATVEDDLIVSLKKMAGHDVEVSTFSYVPGTSVRIEEGPFTGVEGVLVRQNGTNRLVVQIQALQRLVSVEISSSRVRPLDT